MSSTIPPPEPDQSTSLPTEGRVTIQANSINVSGDIVGRDKITNNITKIIYKFFFGGVAERLDLRNRQIMLDKVRTFWVKGVLEQSLHGAALIELGMDYKPDAVQYPWKTVLQRPDRSPHPLPSGAKMIEVFDQEGGELLILGAPGSGKTTMLLDLARDLIARAEEDETLPIPVVFNLSSWTEKHPRLADWLIEELSFRYDVPKKVGKAWIERGQVLPLLDGLDEVKLEQRAACVEAINHFRKEHLVHIVVCSRSEEYKALSAQLRLQSAIALQPLTRKQVDTYLQSVGEQLTSIRVLLKRDAALQELAGSPLMLSILALAYRSVTVDSLQLGRSSEVSRKYLFDTYIEKMFKRRGSNKHYMPEQAIHWLVWIAQRMLASGQTIFLLERMRRDLLQKRTQHEIYDIMMSISIILLLGLSGGLAFGLLGGLVAAVYGVLLGMMGGSFFSSRFVFGFAFDKHDPAQFELVESLRWSWKQALIGLFWGLFVGLVVWLVLGLIVGPSFGLVYGLTSILGIVLLSGLGVIDKLADGRLGRLASVEIEARSIPNQGIHQSIKNSILVGLSVGLLLGPVLVLVFGPDFGRAFGPVFSVVLGLIVGPCLYGGSAILSHYILRFILYHGGYIPFNYVDFLDYAAERILLRKVGGGYIFAHRLLMEHFASLEEDAIPKS